MKTVLTLTIINMRNTLSDFLSSKKGGKKRGKGFIVLMAILAIYFGGLMGYSTFYMHKTFKEFGLQSVIPPLFAVVTSLLILITSFFYTPGFLFKSKDYQMLSALPLTQRQIFLSKFFIIYVYDLLFSIMILGVTCGVYLYLENAAIHLYALLFISVLVLPLVPLFVSALLAFLFGYALRNFKFKNVIIIILSVVAVSGILYASQNSMQFTNLIINSGGAISNYIVKLYPPAGWFGLMIEGKLFPFVYMLLICLVPAVLLIYILPKYYQKLCIVLNQSNVKSDYVLVNQKASNRLPALIKREFKHIVTYPSYLFNSLPGFIICLSILFSWLAMPADVTAEMNKIPDEIGVPLLFITFSLYFSFSMSSTTTSSISIEGDTFWLLKSAPVTVHEVFYSKMLLNILLNLPMMLIFDIVFAILLKATVFQAVFALIIPLVSMLCITVYGLLINIYKPKLDWKNITQAVKNSASALIVTFTSMGLSMLIIGLSIFIIVLDVMPVYAVLASVFGILLTLLYVLTRLLFTKGVARYNEIY